jgi:hypothetical protein
MAQFYHEALIRVFTHSVDQVSTLAHLIRSAYKKADRVARKAGAKCAAADTPDLAVSSKIKSAHGEALIW